MFSRTSILTQVYQNNYPPNWHVYHGKSTRYVGIVIFTIFMIIFAFSLFFSIDTEYGIFNIVSIVFALLAFLSAYGLYKTIRGGQLDRRSVFVVLPEGVVQCYGGNIKQSSSLYFPNIAEMELMQRTVISGDSYGVDTRNYYWLDIYCFNGEYYEWRVMNCIGNSAFMYKTIIAAYKYFSHQNYSSF